MTENVPNLRGLASTFGLSYVPGPWMDGISVSKGVGTVVNGYEAITGQIDVEYKKPIGEGTASGNVFDSSARTLVFVADGSRSFSNTVQLEARWQPLRGLDLDVAWRLNDARQTTAGRLRSRAATRRCWPPPLPDRTVTITYRTDKTTAEALCQAVSKLGYESTIVSRTDTPAKAADSADAPDKPRR